MVDEAEVAKHDGTTLLGYYVSADGGGRICKAFANCLVTTDEALLANTRLIAAAPELLEACKRALAGNWCSAKTCVGGGCICNAIADAIGKAEGK